MRAALAQYELPSGRPFVFPEAGDERSAPMQSQASERGRRDRVGRWGTLRDAKTLARTVRSSTIG